MNSSTSNSDPRAPRRYGRWLFGVAAVCILVPGTVNYIVDPYDVSGHPLPGLTQDDLSRLRNDRLYELVRYNRNPRSTIVLGDSRAQNLREELFAERGLTVANLGYGGGTLSEAIDTFYFALRRTRLRAVVMVVPFNSWSESDRFNPNLVENAVDLIEWPATYYFNLDILRASIADLYANWDGNTHPTQAPPMSKDAFWRYQLDDTARLYYGRWQEPDIVKKRFLGVVSECRRRGIRLLLVVPPTHVDLQRLVERYHLEERHAAYLALLKGSADTLNFDVVNAVTTDRAKFADPFHIVMSENPVLVDEIAKHLESSGAASR